MSEGTYVAVRVLPETSRLIKAFCKINKIPVNYGFEDNLHATILFSRKTCHGLEVDPKYVVSATFDGYALFNKGGPDGAPTVLVAKLFAPALENRHRFFMSEYQATYDFPRYVPHVTISTSFLGDIEDLPPIEFPILLGDEYTESLDLS